MGFNPNLSDLEAYKFLPSLIPHGHRDIEMWVAYLDGYWEGKQELNRSGEIVKYITWLCTSWSKVVRTKLSDHLEILFSSTQAYVTDTTDGSLCERSWTTKATFCIITCTFHSLLKVKLWWLLGVQGGKGQQGYHEETLGLMGQNLLRSTPQRVNFTVC